MNQQLDLTITLDQLWLLKFSRKKIRYILILVTLNAYPVCRDILARVAERMQRAQKA